MQGISEYGLLGGGMLLSLFVILVSVTDGHGGSATEAGRAYSTAAVCLSVQILTLLAAVAVFSFCSGPPDNAGTWRTEGGEGEGTLTSTSTSTSWWIIGCLAMSVILSVRVLGGAGGGRRASAVVLLVFLLAALAALLTAHYALGALLWALGILPVTLIGCSLVGERAPEESKRSAVTFWSIVSLLILGVGCLLLLFVSAVLER